MNRKLLDKWLNGTISPSELEVLKQDPAFGDYLKIDSYVKRLDLPAGSATEDLKDVKRRLVNRPKAKVFRLTPLLKFAAAAAILILVGYFYIASLPSTFETQLGQTEILELPDRSKVTLNENSQLEFRKSTWKENRKVELQGEAFFEVTEGEKFEVHSKQGIVTVLGTKFNISDREGAFRVSCYEGLVLVSFKGQDIRLSHGNSVTIANNEIHSAKKYTMRPGWIYDESSFENTPAKWVLEELKSVYGVNIISENIDVDLQYTGSFTNTDLDSALQTITLPLRLDYVIENKNVILSSKD